MKNDVKKCRLNITIEDEDGIEEWPLPAIVPVVFTKTKQRVEAEVYFGVYDTVRDFLLEYGENPFTREALLELDRRLAPYLSEQGYERGDGIFRYYRSFVLWDKRKLVTDGIREDSYLLTKQTLRLVKKNRTDFDLAWLLSEKLETVFTLKDGEVVSVASVNEHSAGQRLLEAAVYTLPGQRGKGYGRSNVALLCKTLLEKKKGVVYCCSCHNRPSLKIARELGFTGESRFYAVDAYKIEE